MYRPQRAHHRGRSSPDLRLNLRQIIQSRNNGSPSLVELLLHLRCHHLQPLQLRRNARNLVFDTLLYRSVVNLRHLFPQGRQSVDELVKIGSPLPRDPPNKIVHCHASRKRPDALNVLQPLTHPLGHDLVCPLQVPELFGAKQYPVVFHRSLKRAHVHVLTGGSDINIFTLLQLIQVQGRVGIHPLKQPQPVRKVVQLLPLSPPETVDRIRPTPRFPHFDKSLPDRCTIRESPLPHLIGCTLQRYLQGVGLV